MKPPYVGFLPRVVTDHTGDSRYGIPTTDHPIQRS